MRRTAVAVAALLLACLHRCLASARLVELARRLAARVGRRDARPATRVQRGWVRQRTWARPGDLRRLWVTRPIVGAPYLGFDRTAPRADARGRARGAADGDRAAARREVERIRDAVAARPRRARRLSCRPSATSTKPAPRTVAASGACGSMTRSATPTSATFTPLIPAHSWSGAIRTGEALASAAHPDQANAANEFWDKEAASMLAPLLHAAALAGTGHRRARALARRTGLQRRDRHPQERGRQAAADQLEGVGRRDERNRETTVMSALNLLRAYRYPQLAAPRAPTIAPERVPRRRGRTRSTWSPPGTTRRCCGR